MKLLDLYRAILKIGGMIADDDGFISGSLAGSSKPVTIKGKRLVLPTEMQLKTFDKNSKVVFHPLNESVVRGASEVLEKYRILALARLNSISTVLMHRILTLAASTEDHKKLAPDQLEVLRGLKNVNEKTVSDFEKILENMPVNEPNKGVISLFLKRGAVINGQKHSRGCIVSFPLYEELQKGRTVYGVTVRGKDREALIALLKNFFGEEIGVENSYSRGSDSEIAPFMDALMRAIKSLVLAINEVAELGGELFDIERGKDGLGIEFDTSWIQTFEDISVIEKEIRSIPMQAGNEGSLSTTMQEGNTSTLTAQATPVASTAKPQESVEKKADAPIAPFASSVGMRPADARGELPAPKPKELPPPWVEIPQTQAQAFPQQQPAFQQPIQQAWPVNGFQQNFGMVPQQQQQQPTLMRTGSGIDFGSAARTDPGIAMAASQMQGGGNMNMNMNGGRREPSWASGGWSNGNMGMNQFGGGFTV